MSRIGVPGSVSGGVGKDVEARAQIAAETTRAEAAEAAEAARASAAEAAETARATAAEAAKLTAPALVSATPATVATALTKNKVTVFNAASNLTNTAVPALSSLTVGDTYWIRNQSTTKTLTQPFASGDTMASGSTSIILTHPGTAELAVIANPAGGKFWDVPNHVRSDTTLDNTFIVGATAADARTTIVGSTAPGAADGRDNDGYLVPAANKVSVYGAKTAGAWPAGVDVPVLDALGNLVDAFAGHRLTTGCSTWPRWDSNGNTVPMPSQNERLCYFTAPKSFTATTLTVFAGGTAAVGTTYCAMALFSVASNGDLTRLAITTSDTTIFSSNDSAAAVPYAKALGSSVALTYGVRYAASILWVGTGTAPTTHGKASAIFDQTALPYIGGSFVNQSTIPSTIASASVVGAASTVYIKIT